MAEQLLTAENKAAGKDKNIQMALVSFSTTAGTVSNFTDTAAGITSTVNGLRADGGTNWEAALKRANTLLASSNRKDVKKYIVFMSDGDPTYRDSANGYTKDCKDQRIDGNRVYLCGTGGSDPSQPEFQRRRCRS